MKAKKKKKIELNAKKNNKKKTFRPTKLFGK